MIYNLADFVRESNRIEGLLHEPTPLEIAAHEELLTTDFIGITEVARFVRLVQPGARLRDVAGLNVRVGNHLPPPGGPAIARALEALLGGMGFEDPYAFHRQYETLHPFMDGNGRSGRALWLCMMGGIERAPLGFLHHWYYQSLQASRP